jgi:hypothetical protein
MEISKGVRIFGIAIIAYGVFILLGIGNFGQFSIMLKSLNNAIVVGLYVFTLLYGVCAVYCGIKVLRLEDWARKVIIAFTVTSIISGFLLNRLVLSNLKVFLLSEQSRIPPDQVGAAYSLTIFFMALATIFELSIVFFFTRHGVVSQFKSGGQHTSDSEQ